MKYIAYFDDKNNKVENRMYALSATNKIKYICSTINSTENVQIISPSWTLNHSGFYKNKEYSLLERTKVTLLATFGARTPLGRRLRYYFSMLMLIVYLSRYVKSKETIIVYHSISLYYPIKLLCILKKIYLILEVEEIYQDVQGVSRSERKNEFRFFDLADAYIFPTILLNEKLNTANKPFSIIHGTYQVEEDRNCTFDDGKIHVVYAGTFDPRKGGALAAAAAAYLPKNYHVHIIGFGSKDDTSMLLKKIDDISKITKATITYDGLLSGEEYIQFLQKCDIGLSTQIPEAAYNESSFPSKILSYMANGLRVVSIRIKAIEMSAIGNSVSYYNEQSPKAIAEAIMAVDINEPYDSRELIKTLDIEFTEKMRKLLKN